MQAQLRIRRFNPEKSEKAWWGDYKLEDVKETDSVLDLLHRVKWEIDGSLTLRRSGTSRFPESAPRLTGPKPRFSPTLSSSTG